MLLNHKTIMPSNDFKDRVKQVLTASPSDPRFEDAVEAIREAAAAIEESGLVPGAQVRVEPGHLIRLGQQFNVVMSMPSAQFREVLFRAYVPEQGFPVNLDFFGEEPVTCSDRQELESEILRLLQDRNVVTRLQMIGRIP